MELILESSRSRACLILGFVIIMFSSQVEFSSIKGKVSRQFIGFGFSFMLLCIGRVMDMTPLKWTSKMVVFVRMPPSSASMLLLLDISLTPIYKGKNFNEIGLEELLHDWGRSGHCSSLCSFVKGHVNWCF